MAPEPNPCRWKRCACRPDSVPKRGEIIGEFHKARLWGYFPQMFLTTLAVVVLPVLCVTILSNRGAIGGFIPLLVAGTAISLLISTVGAAIWKTRPGSGDLLFSDLIIWGFVRRWRVDRRLSSAARLLGLRGDDPDGADDLTPTRKMELLEQLAASLEGRDPYTHGHSRRVARHTVTMAKRMGLSHEQVAKIRTAAAIHDVGKVKTPPEVLGKPGRLSDEEFEIVKRHPVDGARMVACLGDPELTEMVLHHHERLDGGGYPGGLQGDQIPLGARIIAVADTFDAITSARPYRPAKAHRMALDILRAESGTQLDREAVEAFRSYYSGLRPVAVWAVFTSLPQRLFAGLFDDLGAGAVSASKVMAVTAASVVAGAGAVDTVGGLARPSSSRAGGESVPETLRTGPGAQWHAGESRLVGSDRGLRSRAGSGASKGSPSRRASDPQTTARGSGPGGGHPGEARAPGEIQRPGDTAHPTDRESSTEDDRPRADDTSREVALPEVRVPEVKTPEVKTPELKTPEVSLPGATVPEVTIPEVEVPEVKIAEVRLPKLDD